MHRIFQIFILVIATALLLSGCNGTGKTSSTTSIATPPSTDGVQSIQLGNRQYFLAKPANFDQEKAYKLLLAFHGSGQGAKSMQNFVRLENEDNDYIVVYPQSEVEEWNEGCSCNKPHRLGIDDLGFVENVVAEVTNNYNIIESEMYAVGFSQGGLFTQNLMCNSKLQFKAIATVAAPMSKQLSELCQITNKTNYLLVHGTNDAVLPYNGVPNGNFALIGSERAIELIARQNGIDAQVEVSNNENITNFIYQNDEHINQLVRIDEGGHSWTFENYPSSSQIVNFFNSVSDKSLDPYSDLYRVQHNEVSKDIHVRTMGASHEGPAVVLLSGFNKNYHADSAWFALLQPMLAKTHKVHVIERLGNGFSSLSEQPSYTSFAPLLDEVLAKLNEQEIILVTFASGNLLAQAWLNSEQSDSTSSLKGMLWIDPDVLLPHSVALYQDWPVVWYREVKDKLLPHIAEGNWTERTITKLDAEREAHAALIAEEYKADMDWAYYDVISKQRSSIEKQIVRANEIINYHDDLALAMAYEVSSTVPLSVIDTDFESIDIANAEPDFVARLIKWQEEGSEWSKLISERSNGHYIPLENSDHMAVFQHPDEIITAINQLANQ